MNFQKLKKTVMRIHAWILQNEVGLRRVFLAVIMMSLFAQAVDLGAMIWQRAQPLSILRALDDDEANGVSVAMRTRVYNDSDFHTYGVLYYRVVHLVQHLVTPTFHKTQPEQPRQTVEMAHDFVLDLVSLMALYGIAFLLAWMLTADRIWQGMVVFYLVGAFANTSMWVQMLFAAKPDVFLCGVVLAALLATWRVYADFENKQKIFLAAILWGLAFCTKLVVLYFSPAIILLLVGPRFKNWKWIKDRCLFFGKILLITYFGVGFPNNFTLIPPVKNLLEQSSYLRPLDWEFFKHWWTLWAEQIAQPLWVLLVALILVPLREGTGRIELEGRKTKVSWDFYLKMGISVLLPTLWLFSKKTITLHEWYPLPFVTAMLGMVVWLGSSFFNRFFFFHFKKSFYWALLAFMFLPLIPSTNAEIMQKVLAGKMVCTAEAVRVGRIISAHLTAGKVILADPMIPYAEEKPRNPLMNIEWQMRPELFETLHPQVLVLKRSYYSIFFPPEEGGTPGMTEHIHDIKSVRNFYRPFLTKTEFVDSTKKLWRKTYSDNCTWEIWER